MTDQHSGASPEGSSSKRPAARVLVLMPAHNEEESIGGTIDEIRQTLPDADMLVVSDCSTDRTKQIATEKGARVEWETRPGVGSGCRADH